ncbi:MAG: hypothetical protein FWG43_05130, partial [Clostridiales bacterium]|nr:hypothetical protein [Clostridiales bacterium]
MNRNLLLLAPLVCFLFNVVTITGCVIENVEQSTTSLSAFEEHLEEPMPDTAEPEPILNASEQKFPGSASESANIQSNPTESKAEAFPAFDWDAVAQWREPAVEALVREKLGKVSRDIMQSDLDHIWAVELFGDTHIYFNADGGYVMWKSIEGYSYLEESWNPSNIDIGFNDAEGNEYKSGIYSVNEEQFKRGSILSLKDFGNFRNLRFLHVYKNSLQDLDGLSDLENLIELKLTDNDIFDITALSLLTQIDSLRIYGGLIEDI